MNSITMFQLIFGVLFLAIGLLIFALEMYGVFRMKYVLNRMHPAALGDTLGLAASLIGLMFLSGINFTTLKLFLIILFLWCSSPVASHLIAKLEVMTGGDAFYQNCSKEPLSKVEAELHGKKEETK